MKVLTVLARVDWWLSLVTIALCLVGLLFLRSTTQDDPRFQAQFGKQVLFVILSLGLGFFCILVNYLRVLRAAFLIWGLGVLSLALLPVFGSVINGSRRWYSLPGFSVQPSEFAKLTVVIGLAALLRFDRRNRAFGGLFMPLLVAMLPAGLVLLQPDLGSALVFGPVLLAMSYAAGVSGRTIAIALGVACLALVVAYFEGMHGYQKERISVWAQHWYWDATERDVREILRGAAYQPWQALIAMGSGGMAGFGLGEGPQNRYSFLPYRSEDYIFAVVGEETGWLGCALVLLLYLALVFGLLRLAMNTRERFGRLVCVGVAAWIGCQSLMHAAVCCWLVPSTGVPMPMVSYGGSSVLATVLGVALCLGIGARREPVLAGDGFR
ncbi:MAG: FtsW/RodA/SpoVE family cell cycle protein [Planctomycetota bacterium]|nr:FtsW/RodA/SpoVE family cell cycle protein [Planctomycetota bacterium]MSR39555.1 rod shape-determining protein RodA [Planctomycetota bacterium]